MSKSVETTPANPSNPTSSPLLEDVFFAPLFQALQVPGTTRSGAAVDDASFVALAVLRLLENSKTGRDFIQTHGIPTTPGLTRSNSFDGLASSRRLKMFIALKREIQRQQLLALRSHDDRHLAKRAEKARAAPGRTPAPNLLQTSHRSTPPPHAGLPLK